MFVRISQGFCKLQGRGNDQIQRHGPLIHHVTKGAASKIFHRNVGEVIGLTYIVNGHDIGVR